MKPTHVHDARGGDESRCPPVPRFERVNYFHGQMLGVREFRAEQQYFREKLRLHNRYLHGYGVVCGLSVEPCGEATDPCADSPAKPGHGHDPEHEGREPGREHDDHRRDDERPVIRKPCVQVACGLAIDCLGNELVVRDPIRVDFLEALDAESRRLLEEGKAEGVWIALCFVERPVEPVRPISTDFCGASLPDCVHGRLRDDVCVKVRLKRSHDDRPEDDACSPCERDCADPCLVLAEVDRVDEHGTVVWRVDDRVRRTLAPYETTRVVGISWTHGAGYSVDEAREMLDDGLELQFSSPVYARTITPGVIDIWAIEGGRGRRGQIYHVDGRLEGLDQPLVRSVRYRQETHESFQEGDRVIITLRASFVLDHCCRPVDGEHVGGRVPIREPRYQRWERPRPPAPCERSEPRTHAPWTSGNGIPGGTFESWFFIKREPRESSEQQQHRSERAERRAERTR